MSGGDFLKAADEAARLAVQFAGLVSIEAELRRIGSIQNAGDEAAARLTALKQECEQTERDGAAQVDAAARKLADLIAQQEGVNEELEAKRREGAEIVKEAQAQAAQTTDVAGRDANAILADARVEATRTASKAEAERKRVVDEGRTNAAALLEDAKREAAPFEAQIADGKSRLAQVNAEIATAQATLDRVNDALSALRAKF